LPLEKVLTAILFVLHEGCTWRGIDQPEARWNSVYQYYRRWCRDGIWQEVWEQVAPASKKPTAVYGDSSFIKVHRSGLNAAGGRHLQAVSQAEELFREVDAKMAVLDKGYDSDALRTWLLGRGMTPCIPSRSNRVEPRPYRKASYRKRHVVENFFAEIKTFRRVATRYDKLAETFFGWVMLAVIVKLGM
jgi:transposase